MGAIFLLILLLVGGPPALSQPPAGAPVDPAIAAWYHSLQSPSGLLCCDISDCREVKTRQTQQGWEVFVDKRQFGESAPDAWVVVPAAAILEHTPNPTGNAVACWYGGTIRCFVRGWET